jgi:hypothetical protein
MASLMHPTMIARHEESKGGGSSWRGKGGKVVQIPIVGIKDRRDSDADVLEYLCRTTENVDAGQDEKWLSMSEIKYQYVAGDGSRTLDEMIRECDANCDDEAEVAEDEVAPSRASKPVRMRQTHVSTTPSAAATASATPQSDQGNVRCSCSAAVSIFWLKVW